MKLENAPALEIDKILYTREPIPVHVVRERRIVWNLLKHLEDNGITPTCVYDGEEIIPARSKKAVMEILFNRDEACVYFTQNSASNAWVFFVLGNDIDVVSDYTIGLDPIISKFKPEAYA